MTLLPASVRGPCRLLAVFVLMLGVAGCDATDPYKRADVWRPAGVNDMNLELQVANTTDLRRGRGTDTIDGESAGAPIDRLRRDKPRALPQSGISAIGTAGGTGSTN